MSSWSRAFRVSVLLGLFGVASHFALQYGTGGLWHGLRAAHAVVRGDAEVPYDLTQLRAVNRTLDTIRKKYVEPERVDPRQMFLGALDQIQKEVAQVIVTHEEKSKTVKVRVFDEEEEFRVDNVQGPWDVSARLREVFSFLQVRLLRENQKLAQEGRDKIDLAKVEYAASNGILRTLDPHSVFLSPEDYRDMNVSTTGHFGGLGIVISIRDQMLTVMKPMPGTPAGKAGLRRLDRIVKIQSESTTNMPLEDAVNRLRGEPGSKVTIWIHREGKEGWSGSRPFELTREVIRVASVEYKKLEAGVGYVRLKQFQATTAKELSDALASLRTSGALSGLILDLRDNPGGLLDQAGKVADLFLSDGTIYATVGHSEGRHEQRAARAGTEPEYPMIVLVSGSSASASEIVSGALKNNGRAVVVGQTTFGKGSVQLVFPDVTPEGAALKLTIAQYLTPGDISIQGVGVVPDIALEPMTVDTLDMNLFKDEGDLRERDLRRTLLAGGRRSQEPPKYELRFQLPESVRAEIRDRGAQVDDEFQMDAPIRLSRELLGKMSGGSRETQLRELSSAVLELGDRELSLVTGELSGLGIDFSAPPKDHKEGPAARDLAARLSTDRPAHIVTAGEAMSLEVEVKNQGKKPIYRLYAVTKSDASYYDQKELVLGKIMPGETKTAKVPLGFCAISGKKPGETQEDGSKKERTCKIPPDAVSRQDVVRVRFFAEGGEPPPELEFRPTVRSLPPPVFAYGFQVLDSTGNGDGKLEIGESATVFFRVKNVGAGPSMNTQALIRNLTGDGVLLRAGRFDLSKMRPGEEREVEFTFDVIEGLREPELKLELSVIDSDLRVASQEKIKVPVITRDKAPSREKVQGAYEARSRLRLLDAPSDGAQLVGTLEPGLALAAMGRFGDFLQVRLSETRFAFVKAKDLATTQKAPSTKVAFQGALTRSPPALFVQAAQLATSGDSIRIEGTARDESGGVLDAFVFVGSRKVLYQPNLAKDKSFLAFSAEVPLKPGVNVVTVVARENEVTTSRHVMVVRKDGPKGEALATPRTEDFAEDWEFGEE